MTFAATYAAITLGYLQASGDFRAMLAWLPAGIATALMIRWGGSQWKWVALGAAAGSASVSLSWHGIAIAVVATISGPWLLARYLESADFRRDFSRRRDVLTFVLAAPIAMLLPPTMTFMYMRVSGLDPAHHEPLRHWLQWWFNATVGTMTVAPTVVAASRRSIEGWRQRPVDAMALLAITTVLVFLAVSEPSAQRASWLSPVGVLIIVVSAVRMDLPFTGLLTIAIAGATAACLGYIEQGRENSLASARVWAYVLVLTGIALIIRALLTERDAAEARLREAENNYRRELLQAARREQQRLGREMHDALGQELTAIALMARGMEQRAKQSAPDWTAATHELSQACRRAARATRAMSHGLLADLDETGDIGKALRDLVGRVPADAGMTVTSSVADGLQFSPEVANSLYRIAQEALNNALKHSSASQVRISLQPQDHAQARLLIEDNGIGAVTVQDASTGGHGLSSMRYRAELVGGRFSCESLPGLGTRVMCQVARDPAAEQLAAHADSLQCMSSDAASRRYFGRAPSIT